MKTALTDRAAMSTHTPGPWVTRPNGGDDDDTRELFVCVGPREQAIAEAYSSPDIGDPEANARLIAAAPDMLAALQEALHIAIVHKLPQFEGRMRAAIAKAEGAS